MKLGEGGKREGRWWFLGRNLVGGLGCRGGAEVGS